MNKESKQVKNGQNAHLRKIIKQSVAIITLGTICLILMLGSSLKLASVQEEQTKAILYTNQYQLGSKTLTYQVQAYAVTAEQEHYDSYLKELNQDKNRDIAWEGLKKLNLREDEWNSLEQIAALTNGLVPLEEEAISSAQNGDMAAAIANVFGTEYENTIDEINLLSSQVISQIQSRMGTQTARIKRQQVVFELLLTGAFTLLAIQLIRTNHFAKKELLNPIMMVEDEMIALADGNLHIALKLKEDDTEVGKMVHAIASMKRHMLDLIEEISEVLKQMGEGKYNYTLRKEYVGDFIQIQEAFKKIKEEMRETFQTLHDVSSQIDDGTGQLADAAEELAGGCTVQAEKVSELVTMIEEIAQSMTLNADHATSTVKIASSAGLALAAGNSKMEELKLAIGDINKCSQEINSIIITIEEIANQTNLLSLNASIEAARAGEAGKGFAVVAQQIKKLAEESAAATNETTRLIQTTGQAVEKGIAIADETAENILGVMAGAKEATEKMAEMADVLQRDVLSMDKIHQSITSVSEIVDSNSASSEETAAVSEEQKIQVEKMVRLMKRFQI